MLPEQVTRRSCPLRDCGWFYDDTGPSVAGWLAADSVYDLMRAHATEVEGVLRAHAVTHDVEEWAQEIALLKNELAAARPHATIGS
jgi:hypothetical protein